MKRVFAILLAVALTGCFNPNKEMVRANADAYEKYTVQQTELAKQPVVSFKGQFVGEFVYHGPKTKLTTPTSLKGNADVAIQLGGKIINHLPSVVSSVVGGINMGKAVEGLTVLGSKPSTANYNNSDVRTGEFNEHSKNIIGDENDKVLTPTTTTATETHDDHTTNYSDSSVHGNDNSDRSSFSDLSDNSDNSLVDSGNDNSDNSNHAVVHEDDYSTIDNTVTTDNSIVDDHSDNSTVTTSDNSIRDDNSSYSNQ